MSDEFATPATSSGFSPKDFNGALILFTVRGVETGISTVYGETDAVKADIVILDGPNAGDTFDDSLVFPKVLQGQLRSRTGEKVLGRLGQGTAKPGQSAPWMLSEATDADKKVARDWLAKAPAAAPPF